MPGDSSGPSTATTELARRPRPARRPGTAYASSLISICVATAKLPCTTSTDSTQGMTDGTDTRRGDFSLAKLVVT